jgi:hypothetical protein
MVREAELKTKRGRKGFEDAATGRNYFAAYAVAWYEAWEDELVVERGRDRTRAIAG